MTTKQAGGSLMPSGYYWRPCELWPVPSAMALSLAKNMTNNPTCCSTYRYLAETCVDWWLARSTLLFARRTAHRWCGLWLARRQPAVVETSTSRTVGDGEGCTCTSHSVVRLTENQTESKSQPGSGGGQPLISSRNFFSFFLWKGTLFLGIKKIYIVPGRFHCFFFF